MYEIVSWSREKHISCTISRYWKMKGSTKYVSILSRYYLLVPLLWSPNLFLKFQWKFLLLKY